MIICDIAVSIIIFLLAHLLLLLPIPTIYLSIFFSSTDYVLTKKVVVEGFTAFIFSSSNSKVTGTPGGHFVV